MKCEGLLRLSGMAIGMSPMIMVSSLTSYPRLKDRILTLGSLLTIMYSIDTSFLPADTTFYPLRKDCTATLSPVTSVLCVLRMYFVISFLPRNGLVQWYTAYSTMALVAGLFAALDRSFQISNQYS